MEYKPQNFNYSAIMDGEYSPRVRIRFFQVGEQCYNSYHHTVELDMYLTVWINIGMLVEDNIDEEFNS